MTLPRFSASTRSTTSAPRRVPLGRAIAAVVCDDDQPVARGELGLQCSHGAGDVALFIVSRHQDRNARSSRARAPHPTIRQMRRERLHAEDRVGHEERRGYRARNQTCGT